MKEEELFYIYNRIRRHNGKKEKAKEILRNVGIEMIDVFMKDKVKKQKEIAKYNKHIDELDIEAYLRGE